LAKEGNKPELFLVSHPAQATKFDPEKVVQEWIKDYRRLEALIERTVQQLIRQDYHATSVLALGYHLFALDEYDLLIGLVAKDHRPTGTSLELFKTTPVPMAVTKIIFLYSNKCKIPERRVLR
jgi:hypothetical protein